MTAGREDGTAGALGQLRTSHADREQAIDVLKAAFVQGRLTKDEFDLRVGQVFASRTYADLDALTADIPDGVTSAQPSAEHAREPAGRSASRRRPALARSVPCPSMASAAVVLVQSSGVPAVAGVLLVGLTGLFVAGLLAALLMLLSWVVRRSQRGTARDRHRVRPVWHPGAGRRARQLPSGRHEPWHMAEAASRLSHTGLSPAQGRGRAGAGTAVDSGGGAAQARRPCTPGHRQ